jgi:hypothetical protein
MRKTLKVTCKGLTFFMMLSHTQTLRGITSKVDETDKHIIMWDLEDTTLDKTERELKRIQKKHNLSTIYLMSDKPKSYRGICFTIVPFLKMLHIISDTKYIDFMFVKYTCIRQRASLRFSPKHDRKELKFKKLESDIKPSSMPKKMELIEYDTGLVKNPDEINIQIGKGVYQSENRR